MELKLVKELVEMMKTNDLSELEIVDGQCRIMLKRGEKQPVPQVAAMPSAAALDQASSRSNTTVPVTIGGVSPAEVKEEDLVVIKSPMVGTFYAAPTPNAEPFVDEETPIETDTVVCIIEAMKVMNEIKSEVKGTVKKVLVKNGAAVEFGQPLFMVKPE